MKSHGLFYIIIFLLIPIKKYGQDSSKVNLGIEFSTAYNYEMKDTYSLKVLHQMPRLLFKIKNKCLYIGPQYIYVFQPKPVANELYNNNSFGLNFGGKIYGKTFLKRLNVFGQVHFSVFNLNFKSYQQGNGPQVKNRLILDNTFNIGLNWILSDKIHLNIGSGFGAFIDNGLLWSDLSLSHFLGLEYDF